jgi:Flp pilus assembly protein TadG
VLLGLMLAGVLEFGRAWGAVDTLAAAAREGARTASVTNPATRESAAIESVRTLATTHFKDDDLDIDIAEGTLAGTQPVVTVSVTGTLDLLFADLLPIGTVVDGKRVIQITRSTTLPDEWTVSKP